MDIVQSGKPRDIYYDFFEFNNGGFKIFDGNKGSEENAIVSIIFKLLNDGKFDNVDDMLKYNGNDYRTFLKNNNRDIIPLHFGSKIKDADFKEIISSIKKMVEKKLQFNKENINELNFDNNEFIEYNGQVFDNSYADRSIADEIRYTQQDNRNYQSLDENKNTDIMMNEEISDRKREVEFTDLNEIDRTHLNAEQQQLYDAALIDQHLNDTHKELSLEDGLTKDEDNNINKLEQNDGSIRIENNTEEVKTTSINYLSEIDRDGLTSTEQEMYDAALKYQEITGELVRLDLDNIVIITPFNEVKEIIMEDGVLVVDDDRIIGNDTITDEADLEFETEKPKKKVLEFIKPYSSNNTEQIAA